MTKPYYQDERVTLYHGDWRELIDEDFTADVIVTDPPYGETSLEWDKWPDGWPALAARHARSMWCFGSMRMFLDQRDEFSDWRMSHDVIWKKHRPSTVVTDRFARIHEFALHWYRGPWGDIYHDTPKVPHVGPRVATARRAAVDPNIRGSLGASVWEDDGTRWHPTIIEARAQHRVGAINPTQKPIPVLEPLIHYGCPPGGTVLDLFAGSSASLVAARIMGRNGIGYEVREEQCESAALRLSQQILDFGEVTA